MHSSTGGTGPRTFTVRSSDIARCPHHRLDVGHYREDGTCQHRDPVWAGLTCAWWALCTNDATGTLPHPVLGDVPVCDRCKAKVAAL